MSLDIIYDFVCVKTNRGVLPIVLTGSKNWTVGRGRSEHILRTWSLWEDDMLEMSEETLLSAIQNRVGKYDPKHQLYIRNGKPVYPNDLCAMFFNACKKAAKIEDICAVNYDGTLDCSIQSNGYLGSEVNRETLINNTQDLEKWIDLARSEYKKLKSAGYSPYYRIQFHSDEKPLKKPLRLDGPVILKVGRDHYIKECTDTSISYTQDIEKAIIFENAQTAKNAINPAFYREAIRPVSANAIDKHMKNKVVITLIDGYGRTCYISQLTSRRLMRTLCVQNAKRFPSEKSARSWIKDHHIEERFLCRRSLSVETLA